MSFEVKEFHFHVDHAKAYGVDEAIFLYNILFWTKTNIKNKRAREDGKIWTYNSYEAFTGIFEFWTYKQMRRIIKSLVDQKVIIVKQKPGADRNKGLFIALADEELFFPKAIKKDPEVCPNRQTVCPNGQTPSYIYTDNKPDKNGQSTLAKDDLLFFQEFWDLYGKKVKRDRAEREWKKNKLWEVWDDIKANIELRQRHQQNWVKCAKQKTKYIPYPNQYLKDKGWLDELEMTHKDCTCQKSNNKSRNNLTVGAF